MTYNWKNLVWMMATILMTLFGLLAALGAAMTYGTTNTVLFKWYVIGFAITCVFILISAKLFIVTYEDYFE